MRFEEIPLSFACEGDWLLGMATVPEQPGPRGVLIVVGGPQYRAGSHRQFTLLARALAEQGIPAMRFDYRGMGDSSGEMRGFEDIGADLRCAIDRFMACVPDMREVVLWGLCDGASAAAMYAGGDTRVRGLVLLNPWVRTEDGLARTTLKHYYRGRILSPELWKKIFQGRFALRPALDSLGGQLRQVFAAPSPDKRGESLPERVYGGLARFAGPVLLVLSGADLTAREFDELSRSSPQWRQLLDKPGFTRRELGPADHTFSRRAWRDQVAAWTADWLRAW